MFTCAGIWVLFYKFTGRAGTGRDNARRAINRTIPTTKITGPTKGSRSTRGVPRYLRTIRANHPQVIGSIAD